jgi:hypothetical protein
MRSLLPVAILSGGRWRFTEMCCPRRAWRTSRGTSRNRLRRSDGGSRPHAPSCLVRCRMPAFTTGAGATVQQPTGRWPIAVACRPTAGRCFRRTRRADGSFVREADAARRPTEPAGGRADASLFSPETSHQRVSLNRVPRGRLRSRPRVARHMRRPHHCSHRRR